MIIFSPPLLHKHFRGPSNVSNTSLLNTSSRIFALNDSIQPFSHGLPGSMYIPPYSFLHPQQVCSLMFSSRQASQALFPVLSKHFRFPQHVDDLLCNESFSRHVCLPCEYRNGSSLTLKVDSFLGAGHNINAICNQITLTQYYLSVQYGAKLLKDYCATICLYDSVAFPVT